METRSRAVPLGSPLALTPGGRRRKREPGGCCATPGCDEPAEADGRFCGPCGERLARVREELGEERKRPGKWGERSGGKARAEGGSGS